MLKVYDMNGDIQSPSKIALKFIILPLVFFCSSFRQERKLDDIANHFRAQPSRVTTKVLIENCNPK